MVQNSVKFIESFTLDIHELCNSFRFTTKRAGEGKLTAHEVDQRLLWFRARQKQHSGSESSKQSSAHEDNQSNNGSQHEPHSAGLAAPNPAGAHLRPISAGGGGGGSRGRKSAGNSAGKGNRSGERGAGGRRSGHGSAEKKPAANSTPVRAGAGGSGIHKPVVIAPVTSAAAGAATNASISQPLSRGGEYDTPTGSAQRSSAAAAPTVIAIQLTAAQAASAASASGLSVAGSPGGEMINTPVFHDQQPTPSPIAAMSEPPVAAAAASSSMSGTAAADAAATAILAAQPAEPSHQPPPHKLALRTSSSHLQHSAADSPSVVHHRELTLAQEALLRHTSGPAAQHQHHSAHYVAANTPTHILRQGSTVSLTQEQEEEAVYRMKI
jgi:hypothetical protein